jgi:hypothetical protein
MFVTCIWRWPFGIRARCDTSVTFPRHGRLSGPVFWESSVEEKINCIGLLQVNQWLMWLAEAESEEEEDDDGDN